MSAAVASNIRVSTRHILVCLCSCLQKGRRGWCWLAPRDREAQPWFRGRGLVPVWLDWLAKRCPELPLCPLSVHSAPCHCPEGVHICDEPSWGWCGFSSSLDMEVLALWVTDKVWRCQLSTGPLAGLPLPLWPYRVNVKRMVYSQGVLWWRAGKQKGVKLQSLLAEHWSGYKTLRSDNHKYLLVCEE